MSERRRFTPEYKLAAIQPLLAGAKSVSQQAEDLGLQRPQLPKFVMVGLPDASLKEAQERVASAAGTPFPAAAARPARRPSSVSSGGG